jgi:predicted house-cleaning noncanonical NTP pyrophosphatase (MazG superfamily)
METGASREHVLARIRRTVPGMRVTYNKLVRDRIPEIIKADGHDAVTHVLDGRDYRAALLAKLVEEAREAQSASADELSNELADVWEVIHALLATLPMTWHELEVLAVRKRGERGGFNDRIFLEYTEQGNRTP